MSGEMPLWAAIPTIYLGVTLMIGVLWRGIMRDKWLESLIVGAMWPGGIVYGLWYVASRSVMRVVKGPGYGEWATSKGWTV